MNLESLRDRLTREHFLRPRCQFGSCRKTVHKGGIYCINHFHECRNKGCNNRVRRLNDKCHDCSRGDNKRRLKEISKIRDSKIVYT